jgi:hypothetical protein
MLLAAGWYCGVKGTLAGCGEGIDKLYNEPQTAKRNKAKRLSMLNPISGESWLTTFAHTKFEIPIANYS